MMGIGGAGGEWGDPRLALPRAVERVQPPAGRDTRFGASRRRPVKGHLAADDIAGLDAAVKVQDGPAAEMDRSGLRLPTHFTARRTVPAPYRGRGRQPG